MDFYSSHVERTLETFCNMNLEMQESQNIGKINKQVGIEKMVGARGTRQGGMEEEAQEFYNEGRREGGGVGGTRKGREQP